MTGPGPDRTGPDRIRFSIRNWIGPGYRPEHGGLHFGIGPDRTGPDLFGNRAGPEFYSRILLEPDRTGLDRKYEEDITQSRHRANALPRQVAAKLAARHRARC